MVTTKSGELSPEVIAIRAERAARAELKVAGKWPPPAKVAAKTPSRKRPGSKKRAKK